MSEVPRIAVGGENIIDFVETYSENNPTQFKATPGGSPFNVAIALALQGIATTYISPISTDKFGDILVQRLIDTGVQIGSKRIPSPTAKAIITLEKGIPSYEFHRDGTADRNITVSGLIDSINQNTDVLHFGGLAIAAGDDADTWVSVSQIANAKGMFVSYDPNIRPALIDNRAFFMRRYTQILSHIHLIKLSDEDLAWLYPELSQSDALNAIVNSTSASLIVLTLGADGALAYTKTDKCVISAPHVNNLIDTVGAGDIFMATLLASLDEMGLFNTKQLNTLANNDLKNLLRRGAQAAALNCEHSGCTPPQKSEIDTALTRL